MKLTALFFALFLIMGYYPASADYSEKLGIEVDCSVWTGVNCDALESSIKNGDNQFSETNLDECLTCNPKKKGFF